MATADRRGTAARCGPPEPPPRARARRSLAPLGKVGAVALALALSLGGEAFAESPGGPVLVGHGSEPYRFFGNASVALPVLVHASEATGLRLRAQLVQLTSDLAVPVGTELDVPLPRDVAGRQRIEIEIELSVPLPAVKRETDFELWVRSRRDRDATWDAAGRIALRVYPDDLLGPVRRWAASHPLRVEDDHGALIGVLRQQRIPVAGVTAAPGSRDGRGLTLYAGSPALRQSGRVPPRAGDAAILFTERQTDGPRLLVERTDRGTIVTVEMRLLDRLATDPLAQQMFLAVLDLVHEEQPSTGGDPR
jgi:hypothetical protein